MSQFSDKNNLYIKEIEIIQDIIKRLAQNSFFIKGWALTLIVGVLVLKQENYFYTVISFIPLITFWLLDAYYLQQERLYRKLFDHIVKKRFKINNDENLFDINTKPFITEVGSIWKTFFSITLILFYFPILFLIVLYLFVSRLLGV